MLLKLFPETPLRNALTAGWISIGNLWMFGRLLAMTKKAKEKGTVYMKNYVKEGQKLPLYGVGPMIVFGIGAITAIGIILFVYIWEIGVLETPWVLLCRIAGVLLIVVGLTVWFIGALRSDMDASIAENRLQTGGVYAWVRNPMYTGWWMLFAGICLQWHNVVALLTIPVNWAFLTVTLKLTEEKWLLDLYGQDYADYRKRVNRCIPWPPHKNLRGDRSTCFGG